MTEELEPGFEILPATAPTRPRQAARVRSPPSSCSAPAARSATSLSRQASSGASSPEKAVQNVIDDLQNADLLGVLDDLAPGERAALSGADPRRRRLAEAARRAVRRRRPDRVSGVHFTAHDLTYADKTITVNDHVQIVQITGGSVDVGANAAQLPFTQRFLDLAHAPDKDQTQHITIDQPVRIAAEKVDGSWYASLFYTAADAAAGHAIPAAADSIPAVGAGTPEDAVEQVGPLGADRRCALGHRHRVAGRTRCPARLRRHAGRAACRARTPCR